MSQWISVKDRVPEKGVVLAWIKNGGKRGGYWDVVLYGDYLCWNDDITPSDPRYVSGHEDDGNMAGSGFHVMEDTHGGPYDTVYIDLNAKVTHWQPLPDPPQPNPQDHIVEVNEMAEDGVSDA